MINFEARIRPALIEKHGNMTDEAITVFRRKWEVSILHLAAPSRPLLTLAEVLLHILRGRIPQQDLRRCHHHRWSRRCHGADGGHSYLTIP